MHLIIYSKPDCPLCAHLIDKLETIKESDWSIEIRDITSQEPWFEQYQYEVPVLYQKLTNGEEQMIPRPSPRQTPTALKSFLSKYAQSA
jgi:glutaredoxin